MKMDKYILERELAPSIYGNVILCREKTNEIRVVIKRSELAAAQGHSAIRQNGHVHEDIEMEKHVLTSLRNAGGHPNIVKIIANFVEGNVDHSVLEYCSNGELFNEVQNSPHRRLSRTRALECFRQVVSAVTFMHSHRFAHGDLSLENVFVDSNGTCKLSDFGLSSSIPSWRFTCAGKPHYMAPEMYHKCGYDPVAADVWALGVMLFMMLTGHALVERATPSNVIFQFLKSKGLRALCHVWKLESHIPKDALHLLERMLQINSQRRYTLQQIRLHPYLKSKNETMIVHSKPPSRWRQAFQRILSLTTSSSHRLTL